MTEEEYEAYYREYPEMRPTPPLSEKGWREVMEELRNPPADTPERRRMFERARRMQYMVDQYWEQMGVKLPY